MKTKQIVYDHLPDYNRRQQVVSIEKAIIKLVKHTTDILHKKNEYIRILDVGCGLGTLLELLTNMGFDVEGIDGNQTCVNISRKYGKAHVVNADSIGKYYDKQSFDIIIFKDSLEHFNNPLGVLEQAKKLARYIIISVPNPVRVEVFCFTNLFRINYSNQGHLCCWDRSHFYWFIRRKANMNILKWGHDEVKMFVGPLERIPKYLRKAGVDFITPIEEYILPIIFPYYTTSNIVLIERNEHEQ